MRPASLRGMVILCLLAASAENLPAQDAERQRSRQLLQRFDQDGNGLLDAGERRQAAAEIAQRAGRDGPATGRMLRQFDTNRDGKLDDRERQAMRRRLARRAAANGNRNRRGGRANNRPDPPLVPPPHRPSRVDLSRLLQRFDADRDGKLTGSERSAALTAYVLKDR